MTKLERISQPHGFFSGKNIMTPDIVGYFRVIDGGTLCAEISRENPPFFPGRKTPMYGVTLQDNSGKRDDLSRCVDSYEEAIAYLEELQEELGA